MPHLSGVFEHFKELSQITAPEIIKYLTLKIDIQDLENIVGNKILYPQTIPVSKKEEEIELAILSTVLHRTPTTIVIRDRIVLKDELINHFPHLDKLIVAVVRAINVPDIIPIFVKKNGDNMRAGTVIRLSKAGSIHVNGKTLKIPEDKITVIPFPNQSLLIDIPNSPPIQAIGGVIGLVFDSREKDV